MDQQNPSAGFHLAGSVIVADRIADDPRLCLFIFPYNRAYQWFLRKRRKAVKPLSEYWTIFFRVLAVAFLFVLCIEMYNVLARNSPMVPK